MEIYNKDESYKADECLMKKRALIIRCVLIREQWVNMKKFFEKEPKGIIT